MEISIEDKKRMKWGWLLISGAIFFALIEIIGDKHLLTKIFFGLSLALAPLFYYWIREKIAIKNKKIRDVLVGIVVIIIFIFSVAALDGVLNAVDKRQNRQILANLAQPSQELKNALLQINKEQEVWHADWEKRDAPIESKIQNADSKGDLPSLVSGYKALRELNTERRNSEIGYIDRTANIALKYYPALTNIFSNLKSADQDFSLAYDVMLEETINYYQAMLDGKSDVEIKQRQKLVNEKVDELAISQQTALKAKTEYDQFFNKIVAE